MNKFKKIIIKFIVLVILISSSLLFMTGKVNAAATRNYNFNATNILDNLSKDPTFGLLIPIVSSDCNAAKTQVISVDKVKSDFKAKGLTVKSISTTNKIATGTEITVNENANKYTILIYGDVNCDGKINGGDVSAIISNNIERVKLSGIKLRAADLKLKNYTTWTRLSAELSLMIGFNVGKSTVPRIVSGTPVLYNPDTTKPVITLKQTAVTLKVGEKFDGPSYIQSATDDADGNIISKVTISGQVNTNVPKEYTVSYNVTDNAGNKADTKTLKVTVKDYLTDITVDATNAKKTFNLNEAFSTTGLVVTAKYKSGATKQVTSYTTAGFSSTTAGQKTITVTYVEDGITKTTTYKVDVVNNITDIKLEGLANVKAKYKLNDTTLDTTNLVVKLVYADTTEQETTLYTTSGFDTSTVGEKTITVTYNNQFSKTFKINVYDPNVVVAIDIDTIGENELRMERPISKAITFKNEFNENVDVKKSDISITCSNTVSIKKNKAANTEADDIEAVNYLRLIPQSEGSYTITVSVGSVSKTISGSVVAAEKITSVVATATLEGSDVYIYITAKNQYNENMDIKLSDIGETDSTDKRIRVYSGKEEMMGLDVFDISNEANSDGVHYARTKVIIRNYSGITFTDDDKVVIIECKDANDVYQTTTVLLNGLF